MKLLVLALFSFMSSYALSASISIDVYNKMCPPTTISIPELISEDDIKAITKIERELILLEYCDSQVLSFTLDDNGHGSVIYSVHDSLWITYYIEEDEKYITESIPVNEIPAQVHYGPYGILGFFKEQNKILSFDSESSSWVAPPELANFPSGTLSEKISFSNEHIIFSITDGNNKGTWLSGANLRKLSDQPEVGSHKIIVFDDRYFKTRKALDMLILDDVNSYNNIHLGVPFESYESGRSRFVNVGEDIYILNENEHTLKYLSVLTNKTTDVSIPGSIVHCNPFDEQLYCLFQDSENTLLFARVSDGGAIVDYELEDQAILDNVTSLDLSGLGEVRFIKVRKENIDILYAITDQVQPVLASIAELQYLPVVKHDDINAIGFVSLAAGRAFQIDYVFPASADAPLEPLPKYIEKQQEIDSLDQNQSTEKKAEGGGSFNSVMLLLLSVLIMISRQRDNKTG